MLLAQGIVFLIIAVDQLTKYVIVRTIPQGSSIPVIKGVFHLTHIENSGAAFGIFKDQTVFFIVISVAALIFIFALLKSEGLKSRMERLALYLVLAGAAGNLIDRFRLGRVIDFLDFRVWPVFNVADSCITIGALLLLYKIIRSK